MKRYIYEIKKAPLTTHIKAYRFLKKRLSKPEPELTNEQFLELCNKKLNVNKTFLFTNIPKNIDITKEANKILKHEHSYLGRKFKLENIEWNKDFLSGKVWENEHYTQMQYENLEDDSDIKIVWDFNRLHHLPILAIAYSQSKKTKYLTEITKQLESWFKENPYQQGPNWLVPMEIAIRAINIIFTYQLIENKLDKTLKLTLSNSLYHHAKHIKSNLEWSPKKENHYISDLTGLYFIGTFFQNYEFGQEWIKFAKQELEKEMKEQVSNDGVDYEASLNYHRLVTELFLLNYILAKNNKDSFSTKFTLKLEAMLNFIMYYTQPNGEAPQLGDCDNGRVLDLWSENINDHRELLTIGSVLFNRPDFKAHGKLSELLFYLINKEEYNKIQSKPRELESKKFTHYYIMRQEDFYLIIHCGDIGRKGFGGHGHCDQLSFHLFNKKPILVDPGTGTYTRDIEERHMFRSTSYHNTLKVNGKEQDEIEEEKPFSMIWKSKAKTIKWSSTKNKDTFIGIHYGFKPITHKRKITFDKKEMVVTIQDKVSKPSHVEINFHLGLNIKPKYYNNLYTLDSITLNTNIKHKLIPSFVSKEYNHIQKSKCIQGKGKNIKEIKTVINLRKP